MYKNPASRRPQERKENGMTIIHVPRPETTIDPNRGLSSLSKMQIEHFHEAEKRLPARYHSGIYVSAIKTEGEAANYIRHVTEAIHKAHDEAAAQRKRLVRKPERGLEIAAAADEQTEQKRGNARE
jgi:hypothetical protein